VQFGMARPGKPPPCPEPCVQLQHGDRTRLASSSPCGYTSISGNARTRPKLYPCKELSPVRPEERAFASPFDCGSAAIGLRHGRGRKQRFFIVNYLRVVGVVCAEPIDGANFHA
jgi:hypothetical protein